MHLNDLPKEELSAIKNVLLEFSPLTNSQAYYHVFKKRLMKLVPGKQHEFLGCTHRADMIPYLLPLVESVPAGSEILDLGAGAGDVVNFALKYCKSKTWINIEEPNQHLIQEYINKISQFPNLELGTVHQVPIQALYDQQNITKDIPQDLVLSMHMIYHLTDFTQPNSDPFQDLIEAVSFMYAQLAPGGTIFLAYSDLASHNDMTPICGIAVDYYENKCKNKSFAENLRKIYNARNELLANGQISAELNKQYPQWTAKHFSYRQPSYFFADTIADLGAAALAAELCESNENLFDIQKLEFCIEEILRNPSRIGLIQETRNIPQKGMWRANEPQVISIIIKGVQIYD